MMKRIYIVLSSIIVLIFTACGDNGDGKFDTGLEKVIVVTCSNGFTTIDEGDILAKDEDNTVIQIVHDSNNTKKVCVDTGSAHIIKVI